MCLPELLMDVVITKGDTVKMSVISSHQALCHFHSVSRQIHVTDCGVWFSCHVIGLLIKDVADKEHNGQDCVAEARSGFHAAAKRRKRR